MSSHSSLQFTDVLGHLFMKNFFKIPPQHLNGVKEWTLTLPFQQFPPFFSLLDGTLLVCLGSLSCCITQFWLSLSCWTDGLTFVFKIFWYKVELLCFFVLLNMQLCIMTKHLNTGFSSPRDCSRPGVVCPNHASYSFWRKMAFP